MNGFLEKLSLQDLQDLVSSSPGHQEEPTQNRLGQNSPMTLLPPLPLLPHHHPLSRPLDAWMHWSQSMHHEQSKRLDVRAIHLSRRSPSNKFEQTIERHLERQNQWQQVMLEETRKQTLLLQSLWQESQRIAQLHHSTSLNEPPVTAKDFSDKTPQDIRLHKSSSTLVDTPWLPDTPAPLTLDSLPIQNPLSQIPNDSIKDEKATAAMTPVATPVRPSVRSLRQKAVRAPPPSLILETHGDTTMQEGSVDESFFS